MKKKAGKYSRIKKAGFLIAGAALGGMVLLMTSQGKKILAPGYQISRVIDGDTFETKEKQLFRLASIEAPEVEYCGGSEAKRELEKHIKGKTLYIKTVYLDQYRRNDSLVYTADGFVNEAMIKSGWAALNDRAQTKLSELYAASEEAKKEKRGIYSRKCTQEVNPIDADCNIKGNRSLRGNDLQYYHMPACASYAITVMQLYAGDQWFCTEEEAKKAGFIKAKTCPVP